MEKVEYYVSNPNKFPVQIGDKFVAAFATDTVFVTHEEALSLKSKGWSPQRRLKDMEQEMSPISSGGGGDVEQLETDLNTHKNNSNNPHEVTAAQVGSPTTATFNAHANNKSNPHEVTAAQVGAATPASVNSAISTAISNLNLGSAATANTNAFATATQGGKADSALQPNTPVSLESVEITEAGKGVRFTSPDGTMTVELTIDDAGEPVWTTIT